MKIALVICEYNPFQSGHAYHLSKTLSKARCDKIICIMSGNVTQRGELAVADKYTRAKWAILSGADLVVELPPEFVLSSAEYFALGGVKIANAVKGEKVLSFGSECGDIDALRRIAEFKEDGEFKARLGEYLKQGMGYAKSFSLALGETSPALAKTLSSPNNLLGAEYLRALKSTNSNISPMTVAREGGDYRDNTLSAIYSSSTAVRKMLADEDFESIKKSVPKYVFDTLAGFDKDRLSLGEEKLFSLLKFTARERDLKNIHGVKEGIENRILSALAQSHSLKEFFAALATKRYTNAYLARTALNILLDNRICKEQLINSKIERVNALAVEENSKDLLSQFDCAVNTRNSALERDSLILAEDRLYSSVYSNLPTSMIAVKR